MSDKTFTISVHKDDTRRLALASLSFILGRHGSKYSNQVEKIKNQIETGTKTDTLQSLQDMIEILEETCQELSRLVPFVQEFDD